MDMYIVNLLGLAILAIISIAFILLLKMEKLKQLRVEVNQLKKTLEEMDEQAKLVIRTDMELNKTQEELDKRMSGLYALHKLSREISTTLDEKQIFKSIEASYLENLGFEKALTFLWDDKEARFLLRLSIGYTEDLLKTIQAFLDAQGDTYRNFVKNEKTLSSLSMPTELEIKDQMNQVFKVTSFVISPILPKEGNQGFLFVGTESTDTVITEGDEELITILTNQLSQTLENARLFEKTWMAHQDLEKRVEERTRELTLALEEVQKVNKRKSDFVSSVSHELRTPLTSIKGYASILLSDKLGQLPPEVRLRLEKINRHSDELAQFVNDLLDISRIESGKVIMKQEPQELKKILEEVLDLLSVIAKEKQIELSLNLPEDLGKVLVDYSQIKRVFINFINNAIKFTPANGKITIQCRKLDKEIQVDITDTGCGIPEEAQEKIFEEFYRVDNPINQQLKGTGLGLTLVKNIIEAHKGRVWVKSKVGAGSTFSFTLPQST